MFIFFHLNTFFVLKMEKAISSGTFLAGLLLLAILTIPSSAYNTTNTTDMYTAQIQLSGTMNLQYFNESYNINVTKTFLAMVPNETAPGEYNASFEGYANVENETIEFYGMIETECGEFKVDFTVANVWPEIPTGKCWVSGGVHIIIQQAEIPPIQYTWINTVGTVEKYGNQSAYGWLNAITKVSQNESMAKAHLCWMPINLTQIPETELPSTNITFTFTFYTARLINATNVQLNYSSYDLYIEGLWTIYNVTFYYYDENGDFNIENYDGPYVSVIAQNVTGQLKIYDGWTSFTVTLTGFEDINGKIIFSRTSTMRSMEGDVNFDGQVDIFDLVHVAKRIGSTPGCVNGKINMNLEDFADVDLNFDFQVDIYDLWGVATEIGS